MGRHGTSGDLNPTQAPSLLIHKDFVLAPIPIIEQQCKTLNFKSFACGIIQLCTNDGEALTAPLPYALLLNNILSVTDWLITGETNDDGIFHTHCILKTQSRVDSLKRSMHSVWTKLQEAPVMTQRYEQECLMDIVKLQKCHRVESMIQYLMKSPQWVLSNNENLLELAVSIDGWNLNARFKSKPETPISSDTSSITKDLIEVIQSGNCKTLADMIKHDPERMSKYLHRPGLLQIVNNCLTFVQATGTTWSIQSFSKYPSNPAAIHKCLLHQGIRPTHFDVDFHAWLTKKELKRNTFLIYGPSNTGKSAFIHHFKSVVSWGEVTNGSNNFNFESLIDCAFAIHEEPLISPDLAEKYKQVMEGMTASIQVKYKKPYMLPRTPVLMTANHYPWRFCSVEEPMMRNRMFIHEFNFDAKNTHYICRSSECSCECCYCTASSGRSICDGSTSSSSLSRTEQSIPTREQPIRSDESSNVRSRSLSIRSDRDEQCSNESRSCITDSSDNSSSNPSEPTCSSSSSTIRDSGFSGSSRSSSPSNRIHSSESDSIKHVESRLDRGCDDSYSRAVRTGRKRPYKARGYDGTGSNIREHDISSKLVVLEKTETPTKTIPVPTKKPIMDRQMDTLTPELTIPTADEWRSYIAFLLQKYG